jgi:hypothetical protein
VRGFEGSLLGFGFDGFLGDRGGVCIAVGCGMGDWFGEVGWCCLGLILLG